MQKYFDLQYNSITLQKDKIVLFNEKEFAIYKLNGQKTFQGKYRKPIQNVLSIRGFRKYMVITEDSAEKFVRNILKRGHEAVIEHGVVTVRFIWLG